jgi:carotenoid cleavage dioxygenase-like enzyme
LVLFERDLPYEISLDFQQKSIQTLEKIKIDSIEHFSAHSTYDQNTKLLHSLEYNVLNNIVSLYVMNDDLGLLKKINVNTEYMPVIHDSYILSNSTVFTDSPLQFSLKSLLQGKIPVVFNGQKPTYIHEICRKTGNKKTYVSNTSFYIFHYANMRETNDKIVIYAAIYDDLDFSKLNIVGKYRRLILDKKNGQIKIEKNPELEKYNLDFPMKWRNFYILRNVEQNRINGFIVCNGLRIHKKIFLQDLSICGEPKIYDNGDFSRIICLGYDDSSSYFVLIDPENGEVFKFRLEGKVKIGFHSLFMQNNKKLI